MAKKRKKAGTAGSISKAGSFKKWSKDVGQLKSVGTPAKKSKKQKYPKTKRGSTATKKDVRKMKVEQEAKYLVNLKKEKEMAEKGWKVVRTKTYLEKPKEAYGTEGYPYAVLNENNTYESFYTWKEKTPKKNK